MLTTALLASGYVLAVPPLFRMRHFWRHRVWAAYAVELAGAALITMGMVLMITMMVVVTVSRLVGHPRQRPLGNPGTHSRADHRRGRARLPLPRLHRPRFENRRGHQR